MLLLVFLAGFLILSRIDKKSTVLERVGFAFPVGLALITLLMALMDWVNIPLSGVSLTIVTLLAVAVPGVMLYVAASAGAPSFRKCAEWWKETVRPSLSLKGKGCRCWSWLNLLWVLLFIGVAYMEYVNFTKCMFYPTYDRDSMSAFDTIGFVCAQEHTFHGMTIFDADYFPRMHRAGSSMSYIPMVQLAYAYVYSFGAETSKAIPAFFYLSFLVGFYGLCRRRFTHTASMLCLMGIILAPEMTAFASHSITNVMQACVASAGVVYVCLWTHTQRRSDLWMGAILLAVNNWMRIEGIVFIGVAIVIVAIHALRIHRYKSLLVPLASLLPLVVWLLYSTTCGLTTDSAAITHLFWDPVKASKIAHGAWALTSSQSFYGWTFYAAALALVLSLWFVVRRKDSLYLPLALVLSIVGYFVVLYQVDYKWDSVENVLSYSAKRFMFCYVPIAWYYFVSVYPVRRFFEWLERVCGIGYVLPSLRSERRDEVQA